jgi:hypothetical protein
MRSAGRRIAGSAGLKGPTIDQCARRTERVVGVRKRRRRGGFPGLIQEPTPIVGPAVETRFDRASAECRRDVLRPRNHRRRTNGCTLIRDFSRADIQLRSADWWKFSLIRFHISGRWWRDLRQWTKVILTLSCILSDPNVGGGADSGSPHQR